MNQPSFKDYITEDQLKQLKAGKLNIHKGGI